MVFLIFSDGKQLPKQVSELITKVHSEGGHSAVSPHHPSLMVEFPRLLQHYLKAVVLLPHGVPERVGKWINEIVCLCKV